MAGRVFLGRNMLLCALDAAATTEALTRLMGKGEAVSLHDLTELLGEANEVDVSPERRCRASPWPRAVAAPASPAYRDVSRC